jgi:hypothetical protein
VDALFNCRKALGSFASGLPPNYQAARFPADPLDGRCWNPVRLVLVVRFRVARFPADPQGRENRLMCRTLSDLLASWELSQVDQLWLLRINLNIRP